MELGIGNISTLFFGKSNINNLENKVFITATLVTFLGAFIGLIWNLFLGMPIQLILLVGIFMLLYFLLFFNARFKNQYNPLIYVLLSLLFLSLLYFLNGGLNGSIPSLYIIFILIFVTISNLKYQIFVLIATIINLLGLFAAERFSLVNIINPYIDNETKELDVAFGYIAALILCFIITNHFKKTITTKNNQLNKLNKSKDLLFNIIAHDLRDPFNGILGLTEMMRDKSENLTIDEFQKYAELINNKSQKTSELLDSLLDWGKIQMDKIQINPQLINLSQNVNEIILLYKDNYIQKEIEINNSITDDIYVFADKDILNTIFRNLFTNAIKFTERSGKIHISAKNYDKYKLLIVVKDNGVGMEKQTSENLFQVDINTNKMGTEGEESTGLGLLVTKELIEKMGETLIIESELNKGSSFKFTIPKS